MSDDEIKEGDATAEEGAGAPEEGGEAAWAGDEAAATPSGLSADEALAEARDDALRARASWSLHHKEVFSLLFANCLFFGGALASWSRGVPGQPFDPSQAVSGLDTIRGAFIFALALYGFWTAIFNIWHRQLKVWPYFINGVLALWVGIAGIIQSIDERMDATVAALEKKYPRNVLDEILWRLGVVPAGHWLLTLGGILVIVLILKGIMAGAAKAKSGGAAPAAAGGGDTGGRRRRRS